MNREEKLLFALSSIKEVMESLEIDIEVTITKNDDQHVINAYKEIEKCVVDFVNSLKPIKFEELEVGMWVWYEFLKQYKRIIAISEENENFKWVEFEDGYVAEFLEGNFYRKQVEE